MNFVDALIGNDLAELMSKYDRPGPRYTSYPTAPLFSKDFGHEAFKEELIQANNSENRADISLYAHIPFCDTLCYFCGCTTVITQNRERIKEYVKYLKREVDLLSSFTAPKRKVVQMHWGGGTPTYLTPSEILDVASHIREKFNFTDDAEISVEIDPRDLTFSHIQTLRQCGFNRISMGVQDFNNDVLTAINRDQGEAITMKAIEQSRSLGFSSINIDLIYGLPLQTIETFDKTLEKIIKIAPERIAVYNFAYVPWMKAHQKLINPEELPTPQNKLKILLMTIKKLTDANYVYIGMDHFAKADDELTIAQKTKTLHRNFQGYSTKAGCDLFGLGMSSISHFTTNYAQNAKLLPDYYRAIDAGQFATEVGYRMSHDEQLRKYIIMRLMCDLILDISDVEEKFRINFGEYFKNSLEKLQPLEENGLIERNESHLHVTTQGRLFLRNIAMCFDAYLSKVSKEKPIFSRTI